MFEVVVTVDELCRTAGETVEETCEMGRFEYMLVLGVKKVCTVGVDVKTLGVWCELDIDNVCTGCGKLPDA
jgi:hypothetical protein